MNEIFAGFVAAVSGKLITLGALILVDFVFGVTLALRQGRFDWSKLTGYLDSGVLPLIAWLAVEALAFIPGDLIPAGAQVIAPQAVYATVFLKAAASIAGHLSAFGVFTSPLEKVGVHATGPIRTGSEYYDDRNYPR